MPETLEASLMIASHALLLMQVPLPRVVSRITEQRASRYLLMREFFRGDGSFSGDPEVQPIDRLQAIQLTPESRAVGRCLAELDLGGVVVLYGSPEDLRTAESRLLG